MEALKQLQEITDEKVIYSIINSFPFYVILIDSEHKIIMANEAVERELGKVPREIIGQFCPKVVHGCDNPIPECPLEKSVECGCMAEVEHFDEEYGKWFLSSVYPTSLISKEDKPIYLHMVQDITERKETEENLKKSVEEHERIINAGIQALTKIIEKRDPYTAGHQQKVSELAYKIACKMNLTFDQTECIRVAGLLHDIGKTSIPIEILCKPGQINKYEYDIIKTHVISGYEILKDIDLPWPVAEIVLQHHERLDGSGYPNQLTSEEILIEAKILGVADVIEAMTSHRPYRPSLGLDIAIE